MTELTTTNIVLDTLFSLGLLICVWYLFIKEKSLDKIDEDTFSISLDEYEKELKEVTRYPKVSMTTADDWKQHDRDTLDDISFETLYLETKDGEKLTYEDLSFDTKVNKNIDLD